MDDMRHMDYKGKNIAFVVAVAFGVFSFAGSISANTSSEREADRERFRDAIEERRDVFKDRVRGITNDHAGREAEVLAAGDGGFIRRILDRISKSRDEFNLRISERRSILAEGIGVERAEYPEGFFPRMAEKFKTAFLRRAR
ncbi:MAG: hypothetical protein UY60_C0003G0005 [Parcubacteria group bacterium GW2011_GWB1_50_9]|uniref:Uncharacterized protein n=1 Tax=Candidatus Adlerbacteria bacterium GW2011_GWC1_50_9 TaxID=1618608 RepID=A0A0G1WN60_9BACT|nr:MAG: hypothetical protein UY60_C0003G0005 [Parcubacteria group bacterium GW2011_GWB1_50_9]KKW20283.1 MAG: hypothetical protein UY61_C0039G0005 [Candidatus Adlerbacteria bacterium GW2011_GWC1_50_9]